MASAPVVASVDLVALDLEEAAEHAADLGVVVDHEELAHTPGRYAAVRTDSAVPTFVTTVSSSSTTSTTALPLSVVVSTHLM